MAKFRTFALLLTLILTSYSSMARQPEKGYRGFAEWCSDIKADIAIYGGPTDSRFYTGVAVSQGYQFNHWLFVGGGVSVEQCVKDNSIYSAPVFAHVRVDLFKKFTPFIDARIGYNFANYGGIYFSPTVGYRFNWGKRIGINIGIGYSMTGNRTTIVSIIENLGPDETWGTNTTYHRRHHFDDTLTLRLGIDF
ncbi:MAG: hypothetical protein K2M19_04370 [Muribaculaceae bacterium]|nr:hypothetical protein [Muribaculaceae bacterium]